MEELKNKLIDVCNESQLPLEAILFVTKDLWRDVEETLRAARAAGPTTSQAAPTEEVKE